MVGKPQRHYIIEYWGDVKQHVGDIILLDNYSTGRRSRQLYWWQDPIQSRSRGGAIGRTYTTVFSSCGASLAPTWMTLIAYGFVKLDSYTEPHG